MQTDFRSVRRQALVFATLGLLFWLALQRLEDEGLVGDGGLETPVEGGVARRTWAITKFGRRVAAAEARRLVGLVKLAFDRHLLDDGNLSALNERTHGV